MNSTALGIALWLVLTGILVGTILRVTSGMRRPVAIAYRLLAVIFLYIGPLLIFLRKGATPRAFLIVLPIVLIMAVLMHRFVRFLAKDKRRLPAD